MGSVIGLLIGFAMMLMVSSHYHFLANRYPDTGGLYNYVKQLFGYDLAFLIAWFMFLIYIAIFWANATSIPLFARYFMQAVFKKGYLFTVFGYQVYLGEALVTLTVMWLVGLLCMKSKKATARIMVIMVLIFTIGITVCFAAAMSGHSRSGMTMSPAFLPDTGILRQVGIQIQAQQYIPCSCHLRSRYHSVVYLRDPFERLRLSGRLQRLARLYQPAGRI